jgi:hypothetical protein
MVRARICGTYSRKRVNFVAVFNPSCFGEPGRSGTIAELPSDTAIKFWRMAANERQRQTREKRKRKE